MDRLITFLSVCATYFMIGLTNPFLWFLILGITVGLAAMFTAITLAWVACRWVYRRIMQMVKEHNAKAIRKEVAAASA